jgi:hypothetical protein
MIGEKEKMIGDNEKRNAGQHKKESGHEKDIDKGWNDKNQRRNFG